ncbi:MAG: VWA domain-containing protein, partial [Pseudomonadales bacterium]|nr:VWA domain-containing protein [Pseudomonadales bacterium]
MKKAGVCSPEVSPVFEIAWPWFALLLPLPWLIGRLPNKQEAQEEALIVPSFRYIRNDKVDSLNPGTHPRKNILAHLIWLLLVFAAIRPQWVGDAINLPITGRDLLLAVDISGSMKMQDMEINGEPVARITATKKIVKAFIEQRKGDRIGLVLFGSNAYLQSPLTFDTDTVGIFLEEAMLGFAGTDTAIGDAIALAVKRLKDQPENSRLLILLTDGNNNAGEIQ